MAGNGVELQSGTVEETEAIRLYWLAGLIVQYHTQSRVKYMSFDDE